MSGFWKTAVAIAIAYATVMAATIAFGTSEVGSNALTRLWSDDRPGCTAAYVRHPVTNAVPGEYMSWLLSAGHCSEAIEVRRDVNESVAAHVNWQIVYNAGAHGTRRTDFAFGSAPEIREGRRVNLWWGETMPDAGSVVYLHGFPLGVERVSVGQVLPRGLSSEFPLSQVPESTVLLAFDREILPGSSGSPVLDARNRVVGVVWGVMNKEASDALLGRLIGAAPDRLAIVLATPVEQILPLIRHQFRPAGETDAR